ncbi:hypothetical protein FRE64_03020 [Euhalothece natronophila Z-M001]|uniref:Uncharacterized protein n=1 Tax=Euhalothece natronophila Z-M001 TaxID=522448 RepID=A0A5B8NLN6_9CHRO|nr:hypothetical protein [Euhalothece natronophila]QDZ38999.1 hypothetical protein FRE64_03020 [Euhalothece natronophila Z-M001]
MKIPSSWQNFLALLPGTLLTVLTITVAFLRFYDEQDFTILGEIREPRVWSNRLTVAALMVAVVNFGVEWNRRNRETNRLAQEEQRRSEEERRRENERIEQERRRSEEERRRIEEIARAENERAERRYREIQRDRAADRERNRAAEERERAARRARIQNRWYLLQIRYQLQPNQFNRRALNDFLAFLQEYGE